MDDANFVNVGRNHPDNGLNINNWNADNPNSNVGAPAVTVSNRQA